MSQGTKFCKHCGQIIDSDCVVCPKCGKQVENLNSYGGNGNGPIIINNNNNNNNNNFMGGYNSGQPKKLAGNFAFMSLCRCIWNTSFLCRKDWNWNHYDPALLDRDQCDLGSC